MDVSQGQLRPAGDRARAAPRRAARRGPVGRPREERFDRLTRLARRLLARAVALVSLLDADRQFFLSAQGLAEPWAGLRQTPLAYSFCRAVVETGLPMSVADAREDARVRGNPAVEELGVVAYAAVPLALPDGCVVGALCGIDHRPRAWSAQEAAALRDLAGAVEAEMAAGLRLREAEAAAAALREGEARYRALFEVSPQMVWFTDASGASPTSTSTAPTSSGSRRSGWSAMAGWPRCTRRTARPFARPGPERWRARATTRSNTASAAARTAATAGSSSGARPCAARAGGSSAGSASGSTSTTAGAPRRRCAGARAGSSSCPRRRRACSPPGP
jgi:PAS domain-containing protein